MRYFKQLNIGQRGPLALSLAALSVVLITMPSIGSIFRTYINGMNTIQVGMTLEQVYRATEVRFSVIEEVSASSCRYANAESGLPHVSLMLIHGRVARIDIKEGSDIKTLRGAGIGDSEAQIKSLYPGQIQVSRHKYNDQGHYLTFIPRSQANQSYRMVFETNGLKVVNYRVGKIPEISYAEGCS